MQEADDETISGIFKLTKKLMLAIKKGLGCDYIQVNIVGKDIPHFHIHLIPRHLDDNLSNQFPIKEYGEKESEEAREKIILAL